MALKDFFRLGKKPEPEKNELERKNEVVGELLGSDSFPVVRAADIDMSKYRKIPWTNIGLLGAAFAMMPESARTITHAITTKVSLEQKLFIELNPKNVQGFQRYYDYGTSGRVWRVNEQGKQVFAGTKYYKEIGDALPVSQTVQSILPIDPMTMAIAAALININQKLDALQEKAEEILQFLKSEKRAVQRGNLNKLVEIMNEYKQDCANEKLCDLRNQIVQTINTQAHQDILFYQDQIASKLQKQKLLHGNRQSQELLTSVMSEFREYQLACYLYGFSTFLDVMLQKNFESTFLKSAAQRMDDCAARYTELYTLCRDRLAEYHHSSFENKMLNAFGTAAKTIGTKINSVSWLNKSPIDEMLIMGGETIEEKNKEATAKHLEQFTPLEDCRLRPFIENIRTVNLMYNESNAMLMDGENLYVLEAV